MPERTRHSLTVRISHWLVAFSGLILLFSGFGQMPMYLRYNVVKIPGLSWSSDYSITLLLHYWGATIFTAAIFFHLVYHLRRHEFAAIPRPGDLAAGWQGLRAMIGLAEEPANAKFQAKQRLAYGTIGGVSLVLVLTGLLKSYKNLGPIIVDPMLLQVAAFAHTIFAMIFLFLILVHLAMILLVKSHWPLLCSMLTGKINKAYAEQHHPLWQAEEEISKR